jgi:Fe-S oxidoreductase
VSNAEPRETLTPWGKMSAAWMTAHGDTPMTAGHAASAWACTGCHACTTACVHRNPVADVLMETRAALSTRGVAPREAERVLSDFARHEARTRAAARALGSGAHPMRSSRTALLIGCGYLLRAQPEARRALGVARALAVGPVALVEGCCGLPLKLAGGEGQLFVEHAQRVSRELDAFESVLVLDPGCAVTLRRHYPAARAATRAATELLLEAAARQLPRLTAPAEPPSEPVRWHDPCQLGRGLGVYDAPRKVLERATGQPAMELRDAREFAPCAGAGGLLPSTMPEVARGIADALLQEHLASGGGHLVTGCPSSLTVLRKRATALGIVVDDIITFVARSLGTGERSES